MKRYPDTTLSARTIAGLPALAFPAVIGLTLLLGACTTEQLPVGAQLSIAPEAITIAIEERLDPAGRCILDADRYVDKALVLALTDAQGSPIGGTDVSVYTDYSGNTFSRFPVLNLYDDRNGNSNGVVDAESELVSGADDAIAIVKTGRFGGDRVLLLRVNTSCAYAGQVFAFADGVTASLQVEITPDAPDDDDEDDEDQGEDQGEDEADPARSPFELADIAAETRP